MNAKKSSRKRESVFKTHVFERLYPSETTAKDRTPQPSSTETVAIECVNTTQLNGASGKVYTVQPPPDGLPEVQPQASEETPQEKELHSRGSETESSDVSEDEEQPPRKRKRKKKHRHKTVESSAEPNPPTTTSKGDAPSQTFQKEPSSQPIDTSSLTKNQRRKLRKKRAKLGRLQNKPPVQATEFTCDADIAEVQGPGEGDDEATGDEATQEVMEFVEAVWRIYSCDTSKAKSIQDLAQQFQTMIGKMSNDELSRDTVVRLRDIKRLLVLQDFQRARRKLSDCRDVQNSTSESEHISLFSTLAEYWMSDIAASDSASGNLHEKLFHESTSTVE